MGDTLDALRRLQEVEQLLADLRRGEDKRARQIRIQKRNIAKSNDLIEQKRSDIRQHQMEIDRLDMDIKSREDVLAKHRAALNKAKTNKEYASILTAINTEKVDSAKLEARELELMSEMDKVRALIEKIEAEQATQQARLQEAEKQLAEYLDRTAERRSTLERQRADVAETIPPPTLMTFERVAERHDGEAMAEIVRLHPKRDEFICSGCNMKITLEIVNALQTRDEIQGCDACGRLLYLNP
jgi:predicted  nucleic acid-binding Zn-ribbon protein